MLALFLNAKECQSFALPLIEVILSTSSGALEVETGFEPV